MLEHFLDDELFCELNSKYQANVDPQLLECYILCIKHLYLIYVFEMKDLNP